MSIDDRTKWNQRYAEGSFEKNLPIALLEEWLPKFRVGKALDIACGAGRNSLFLAKAGFQVDAIDISAEGLKQLKLKADSQGLNINAIEHDFDKPFDFDTDYDLIVVMWYVNQPLLKQLCRCLAPGGYLLCQEHLVTDQPVIGPKNPDFRVKAGALREVAAGLDIVLDEESIDATPQGEQLASARLIARKA